MRAHKHTAQFMTNQGVHVANVVVHDTVRGHGRHLPDDGVTG